MLLAAWVMAVGPTLMWLAHLAAVAELRHNAALLVIGLALMWRARGEQARLTPVMLVLCGMLIAWRPLDAHIIVAFACLTGSAFLLGVRSWATVLFCCCALPIDAQLDAFIGVPARLHTARTVAWLLGGVSSETVLQLESGLAYVEVGCSGVRSLWVGALLFFFASAWLRTRESSRWWLLGGAYVAAILFFNFIRVLTIVAIGPRPLVHAIHTPLGLFGFGVASLLALAALRRSSVRFERQHWRARYTSRARIAAVALFAMLPISTATRAEATLKAAVLPGFTPLPLSEQERDLFERHGSAQASKWRFDGGTAIVVVADSFRAHHAPEVCMASLGHHIEMLAPGTYTIDHAHTGVYWFQSATRKETTLLGRALADLERQPWALVSAVFDAQPSDAILQRLEDATRTALKDSYAKPTE